MYDMTKVAIKSGKLIPLGGKFSIMEQFDSRLSFVIDSIIGLRCKLYGYQYSEPDDFHHLMATNCVCIKLLYGVGGWCAN